MIPAHHARKIVSILAKIATRPAFKVMKKRWNEHDKGYSHIDEAKSLRMSALAETKTLINENMYQETTHSKMGASQLHDDTGTKAEELRKKDLQHFRKFKNGPGDQTMFQMIKQEREESVTRSSSLHDVMRVS